MSRKKVQKITIFKRLAFRVAHSVIRHPGQVRLRRTRAGIQGKFDYIELPLDSGSRPAKRSSSGMTGSASCDTLSQSRANGIRQCH